MLVPLKYVLGVVAGVGLIAALFVAAPWAASLSDDKATASNALLTCEPSQQVVVRHVAVRGELQLSMQCVGATALVAEPLRTSYAAAPASSLARPAVIRRTASSSASREVQEQEVEPKRSWKKTALVIGGSAGAGAGVGAIAGGKKGALIGAAIGGGAASVFEAIKRR